LWKAKRYEAVVDTKTCVETQTDDNIPITDDSTQTETHRDEQALHNPTTQGEVFPILGLAGSYPCFVNGFSSLDPYQLDRYSGGINLQVPS
jgi:hypothetical protein